MAKARKLPSGSYRVNLYIGKDADGKRKYKSFTADTKREAEYLAAQYSQMHIDINRSELLLSEAVERYIKSKGNVLSPSTVRGYYVILRNYLPELMKTRMRDITAESVQIAFNDFAKDHSPKTCRNAHGLISAVLKVNRPELILNTTLPQKQKRGIYVPDEEEIQKIHKILTGKPMEIPFLLAAECGLRASEISALNVKNVFEDHIEVKEARVPGIDGDVLKAPKSTAGYRSVPISTELYKILVNATAPDGRICLKRGPDISNSWSNFKKSHDLNEDFNFHALRHHYASKCLLMGIPQKYIAVLMGHSSLDMIEKVYQHVFPSAMSEYAEKLRQQMKNLLMQHEKQHID